MYVKYAKDFRTAKGSYSKSCNTAVICSQSCQLLVSSFPFQKRNIKGNKQLKTLVLNRQVLSGLETTM